MNESINIKKGGCGIVPVRNMNKDIRDTNEIQSVEELS